MGVGDILRALPNELRGDKFAHLCIDSGITVPEIVYAKAKGFSCEDYYGARQAGISHIEIVQIDAIPLPYYVKCRQEGISIADLSEAYAVCPASAGYYPRLRKAGFSHHDVTNNVARASLFGWVVRVSEYASVEEILRVLESSSDAQFQMFCGRMLGGMTYEEHLLDVERRERGLYSAASHERVPSDFDFSSMELEDLKMVVRSLREELTQIAGGPVLATLAAREIEYPGYNQEDDDGGWAYTLDAAYAWMAEVERLVAKKGRVNEVVWAMEELQDRLLELRNRYGVMLNSSETFESILARIPLV